MSRKRDTNWSRDEITVLLDSIIEVTRKRAHDDKKTNSREVFEYAAKKLGDKGHVSRAEREKCRTKWKKMKEEYTHAKRFREGDTRFKEAPGIQPFFERMDEFINGNFDNISPHSTIVRRTSSLSSSRASSTSAPSMRSSARIAASTTNGTCPITSDSSTNQTSTTTPMNNISNINNNITSITNQNLNKIPSPTANPPRLNVNAAGAAINKVSPNVSTTNNTHSNSNHTNNNNNSSTNNRNLSPTTDGAEFHPSLHMLTNASPISRQNFRHSPGSSSNTIQPATTSTLASNQNHPQQSFSNDPIAMYSNYQNNTSSASSSMLTGSAEPMQAAPSTDHADISYRVSTGCRQITIFGDHDVDIKFRGDCVTINKIDVDFASES